MRACPEHPGICGLTNMELRHEGAYLSLDEPEIWNTDNDMYLEVEFFDKPEGALANFYSSWFDKASSTEDWNLTGSGDWRKGRFFLRDARFRALTGVNDYHFWVILVRSIQQELHLRSVRLIENQFPVAAHEEVLAAFRKEAKENEGSWTVPHYMFHQALVLRRNLGKVDEADRIMKEVADKWPETECMEMYKKMIA